MSTRSNIGIENPDGTISAIYCHFDGYLSGVGETLQTHYQDRAKVERLIALGNISALYAKIEPDPAIPHSYDGSRQEDVVLAYHRDRSEELEPAIVYANKAEWEKANPLFFEFLYLYGQDGTWSVAPHTYLGSGWDSGQYGYKDWQPLKEALANPDIEE